MLNHATIIGRNHRLWQQNGQDAAASGTLPNGLLFGLALDGCGSKYRPAATGPQPALPSHNETGAHLLKQFAADWLHSYATLQPDLPQTVHDLACACRSFLNCLAVLWPAASPQRQQFVATHLLTTIVGFLLSEREGEAILFWAGDGFVCLGDDVLSLDSGNRPNYPAYTVLDPGSPLFRFHNCQLSLSDVPWLAVASDGWDECSLSRLASPRPGLELQRWLNLRARERGAFDDDGAVAVWWRDEL
jgi:hypothetical protein